MSTIPPASHRLAAELKQKGWCIVRGALPASSIAALARDLAPTFDATPFCQGGFYGETTKRFGRLLARDHPPNHRP